MSLATQTPPIPMRVANSLYTISDSRLASGCPAARPYSCRHPYGTVADMAEDELRPNEADILIVDDDDALRREMADYLAGYGFVVHEARDGKEARAQLQSHAIQMVILDVMLPGEDGLSICRSLAGSAGPSVLMLSSMGESIDRVLGLELGADDYVVRPVTPRELLARVRALLRRRGSASAPASRTAVYAFSGFRFDLVRRQLRARRQKPC